MNIEQLKLITSNEVFKSINDDDNVNRILNGKLDVNSVLMPDQEKQKNASNDNQSKRNSLSPG